jgi:hypothetical protein
MVVIECQNGLVGGQTPINEVPRFTVLKGVTLEIGFVYF